MQHLCKTLVMRNQRHKKLPELTAQQNPEVFCVVIQARRCCCCKRQAAFQDAEAQRLCSAVRCTAG